MKASQNLLPILLAFVSAAPMLHADNDPRGTYNGTMQPTYINQQLLNRNPEVYFKPGDDPDDSTIHSNILDSIDTLKQATRAMNVLLIVGGSPGQFSLFIDTGGGLHWNPDVDDSYENPQIAWSADGFSASKAGVPFAYHITGHYRGPAISGEWSVTVDGAAVVSGTFCASKTGSSGGCSATTASPDPPAPTSANGEYNGTIISTDATTTTGRITFTITGSTVKGSVSGTWKYVATEQPNGNGGSGPSAYPSDTEGQQPDAYTGNFSGSLDTSSGSFEADMTGEVYDYKFTGHIRGTVQGYSAHGTWDATNQFGGSSGTWTASRPAPAIPAGGGPGSSSGEGSNSGGTWVHTGSGNDADDYTWVPNSEPPGISGVNDVPGPADLPETGTGILLPGLLTMAGIGLKSLLDSSVTPPPTVDYGSVPDGDSGDGSADGSDAFTDSMTDSLVNTPPAAATPAPSPYGADYDQAVKNSQDATNEYNDMLKQYADFQNGADTTDPQYKVLDQQYKDYLDYLKNKADSNSASADAIAAAVVKQQNTQVLKDYWGNDKEVVYDPTTGQWHDAQTGNLFDPDAWQKSQQDNANADAWGQSETQKMENQQDADSKAMKQLIAQENLKEKELEYLEKLQETGYNKGVIDPGSPHDFFTSTQQLMDDITDGKTVTVPQIRDAEKYLHDRLTGSAQPESSLSLPENQVDYWQIGKTTLYNTVKEVVTGRDADGHFTVAGVLGMMTLHALAIASGGLTEGLTFKAFGMQFVASKWVGEEAVTAASSYFTVGDAIEHGSTTGEAVFRGYLDAGIALAMNAAGAGIHALASNPSVKAGVGEMFTSATNFGKRMLGMPVTEAITPDLQATKDLVTKLLQIKGSTPIENSDLIAQIYSKGGMNKLAQLQAAGLISKEEAAALNAQLHPLLNRHIDVGTYNAIKQFQEKTGVRIKSLLVSDSGSTAKMGSRFDADQIQNYADSHGMTVDEASKELQSKFGNPKCNTDRDVTVVPDFVKGDVEQYAIDHGISTEDAYYKLHNLCTNNVRDNVNRTLISKGFQGGIKDVKFQSYAGFGTASGRIDSYSAGYASRATETNGVAKQWTTDKMGDPTSLGGRQVSGATAVDQNNLNLKTYTGELPPDPDKFSPDQFANYSEQQVTAVMQSTDPKTVAKAIVRQVKLGNTVNHMAGDKFGSELLANAGINQPPPPMNSNLVKLAQAIADNPDNADQLLLQAQTSKEQFQRFSFYQLQKFNNALTANMG
jgi:hypothetical protein